MHDPCQLRDYPEVQLAVRSLLVDLGYTVVETHHRGKTTLCCGEGGAVGCIESRFSHGWMEIQRHESKGLRLVTCCAGCTAFLGRVVPTFHILDLLFRTDGASDSRNFSFQRDDDLYKPAVAEAEVGEDELHHASAS